VSLVSLVKIPSASSYPFREAITKAIQRVDYRFNSNARKVVIKPNLCYYWDHTTGQTTSPQFVSELIDLIRVQTSPEVEIAVVESDASAMRCKYAFRMLGYEKLAKEKNVQLINLTEQESTSVDVALDGNVYTFSVPKIISQADLKINVAHIKYTIDPVKLTCAMKNIFGCNPIQKKFKYHPYLGEAIVALNKAMPFNLHLIDNNIAAGVQPRKMGLVMASQDPVALDSAAAKIAGLNPNKIPYLKLAEKEGVGKRAYVAVGEPLETFRSLYPKPTFRMQTKKRVKRTLVAVGLGARMGLE